MSELQEVNAEELATQESGDEQESQSTSTTEAEVVTIEANNPSTEEMAGIVEHINANFDDKVDTKVVKFNFKKTKDKDTGIESKREPLQLPIPYPTVQGIVAALEAGGKQLELVVDAVHEVVTAQARSIINDDDKYELNATNFPIEKLDWEFIANLPKSQRRGGGIPKEVWEGFGKDYVESMQGITGKTLEQVSTAAQLLVGKLNAIKTNKKVIQVLVEQLAIYAENAPNFEDFKECVEFLLNKAETLLNVSEEDLLKAL